MKRLAWLILLAFGTALAQVSPVDVRLIPVENCDCCVDGSSACSMPDCAPTPGCAQPALQLATPAVIRVAARRVAAVPRIIREKFYAQFLPRMRVAPVLAVAPVPAPSASVPLFQAHCSFLI